jgi:hypothetical protein
MDTEWGNLPVLIPKIERKETFKLIILELMFPSLLLSSS